MPEHSSACRSEEPQAVVAADQALGAPFPSPLEGEGGATAPGEGQSSPVNRRHDEWRTPITPVLRERAQTMRHEPTEAERKLWGILRDRRFAGHKFRRQVPMGRYIVDFYCSSARLIIELDGSQHAERAGDKQRDQWLQAPGYRVLRFWNSDLNGSRNAVIDSIFTALTEPS